MRHRVGLLFVMMGALYALATWAQEPAAAPPPPPPPPASEATAGDPAAPAPPAPEPRPERRAWPGAGEGVASDPRAPIAEIVFEKPVYALFEEWLAGKTADQLMEDLAIPSQREDARQWIEEAFLSGRQVKDSGERKVLRVQGGEAARGELSDWLDPLLGLFMEQAYTPKLKAAEQAKREADAKAAWDAREQSRALKWETVRSLEGQTSESLEENLKKMGEELRDMRVQIAELDARVTTLTERLAAEKPVIQVAAPQDSATITQIIAVEAQLEQVTKGVEAGVRPSTEAEAVKKAIEALRHPVTEVVNPSYAKIKDSLIDNETQLAGLNARRDAIEKERVEMEQKLREAYEREGELEDQENGSGPAVLSRPPRPVMGVGAQEMGEAYGLPWPKVVRPQR